MDSMKITHSRQENHGVVIDEWRDEHGQLHSINYPAIVQAWGNGQPIYERWYKHGEIHRIGEPASYKYHKETGKISRIEFMQNGQWHNDDGPAISDFSRDGVLTSEQWYQRGDIHRNDGPAAVQYFDDKTLKHQTWYIDGRVYRKGKPAYIGYNSDGTVRELEYYQGKEQSIHREDGPAHILYMRNGNIDVARWAINGKFFKIEDLEKYIALSDEDKVALKLIS